MSTYQIRSVKRSIVVRANIDRVWAALTDPAELMRWETIACEFEPRVGGKSKRQYGWGVTSSGTVVEIQEKRKIVIQNDEEGSKTIWTLEQLDDGVEVSIEYTGLWTGDAELAMADNMAFGTYQFMVNLKTVLETGVDIRGQIWSSWLGVSHTSIRPDHAAHLGVTTGSLVLKVSSGSPAGDVGIQAGDVVVAVDGQPVASYEELEGMTTSKQPGTEVAIEIVRNGQPLQLHARLAKYPVEYTA